MPCSINISLNSAWNFDPLSVATSAGAPDCASTVFLNALAAAAIVALCTGIRNNALLNPYIMMNHVVFPLPSSA